MGGYVFLALEGHWKNLPVDRSAELRSGALLTPASKRAGSETGAPAAASAAGESGFSFHVATDRELMTVELPLALDFTEDHELRLALNVDRILAGPNKITIADGTSSTHSRTNDTLADQLRENVERAFAVISLSPAEFSGPGVPPGRTQTETQGRDAGAANAPLLAPNATPYPLAISRFFPWLRCTWQFTMMPVGTWMRRTAVSTLLTFWPPLPPER